MRLEVVFTPLFCPISGTYLRISPISVALTLQSNGNFARFANTKKLENEMSKQHRSGKKTNRSNNSQQKASNSKKEKPINHAARSGVSRPTLNRRKILQWVAGIGVAGVGASTLHAYDKNQRTLHDLSVIGGGKPVVVQIHDPSCPTCRRLKSAVTTALEGTENIQFRLADITTSEGKALQNKYNVPHVTLLFFNQAGKHVHTSQGLLSADQVESRIQRYLTS